MTPEHYTTAWSRRPSSAVTRLQGRQLLLLSARDLLRAASKERALLIALIAPAPAALAGFARAARDAGVPFLMVRPSGAGDEKGPEEARDDGAFVESALRAAEEVSFGGPIALLKEPPRPGSADREHERLEREIDSGFTGLAVTLAPGAERDGASASAHVCALDLGLELIPSSGGADEALLLVRELRARGATPSAVRLTGFEDRAAGIGAELDGTAISTATDSAPAGLAAAGVQQLIAAGPFLRALKRAAPPALWERISEWAKERSATLAQAAARHQRQLRDLPSPAQRKLEALAYYEALELFAAAGCAGSNERLLSHVGQMAP